MGWISPEWISRRRCFRRDTRRRLRRPPSANTQDRKTDVAELSPALRSLGQRIAGAVTTAAAANLDSQALDFLVQSRKRNLEALGRFGLVPICLLEHVYDHPAFNLFHDLKERRDLPGS